MTGSGALYDDIGSCIHTTKSMVLSVCWHAVSERCCYDIEKGDGMRFPGILLRKYAIVFSEYISCVICMMCV